MHRMVTKDFLEPTFIFLYILSQDFTKSSIVKFPSRSGRNKRINALALSLLNLPCLSTARVARVSKCSMEDSGDFIISFLYTFWAETIHSFRVSAAPKGADRGYFPSR